ncbi:MAG: FMN-binding protein [Lachnospiraceae bacterium]|nr:FMN-binding protein [Lachnospiraceae bacterium]MDE6603853.1 FMN-binding protein [Lachnospiraceae bacterium]
MKASGKRIFMCMAVLLLLPGSVSAATYLKSVADYQKAVKETTIGGMDITGLSDGVYVGEYDVNFIYAKVEVTVQDGKMTDIAILEHKQERGKAAEGVVEDMIAEQKTDVEAVSGATNSSTVIKKAVENALRNAAR